jgi:hypothetical protein
MPSSMELLVDESTPLKIEPDSGEIGSQDVVQRCVNQQAF